MDWGAFILIATGVFWYRAAQVENVSAVYWVSLSILSNLAAQWLVGTYTAMLVSQVLLFALITVWRAFGAEDR